MIVVADAGPLHYLVLIGRVAVLTILFQQVAIPDAVRAEFTRVKTPAVVKDWMNQLPGGVQVHRVPALFDPLLVTLDEGERQAIVLARELRVEHLLVDDLQVRLAAERDGLRVIGTVGILQRAGDRGLLDFAAAFENLAGTNFRMSPSFRQAMQRGSEKG